MPRSAEQSLRDLIASDILYMFKFGDGKLLKDDKCAKNIGKLLAVEGNCRKVIEMMEGERNLKKEKP